MDQWFCLISWKTIWWTSIIILNIGSLWCKYLPHKMCVISDLHFMVQWFCLISWKLFDGLMLYWRYWFSVTQTLNWNYICRSVTFISWSSEFALYLGRLFDGQCHNWNIGSMWCKDLPHKMYVGQWPTFHGPVILSYILKTFLLNILIQCDIKFDLQIYICKSVTYKVSDLYFVVQWFCLISSPEPKAHKVSL